MCYIPRPIFTILNEDTLKVSPKIKRKSQPVTYWTKKISALCRNGCEEVISKWLIFRGFFSNLLTPWGVIGSVPEIRTIIFYNVFLLSLNDNVNTTSISSMVLARKYLAQCPATSFSWTVDKRTGAVLCRIWFSVSGRFFLSRTGSVQTMLKRRIAAVISLGWGEGKITTKAKIKENNGLYDEIFLIALIYLKEKLFESSGCFLTLSGNFLAPQVNLIWIKGITP